MVDKIYTFIKEEQKKAGSSNLHISIDQIATALNLNRIDVLNSVKHMIESKVIDANLDVSYYDPELEVF